MEINLNNKLIQIIIIIVIIAITTFSYSQGMLGGYLFDDIPNLQNINVFSRFNGIDAFIRYINSFESGPLKRPISTLSFLLNSTTLTVNAFNFKVTNLIIHLINGLLLYIVTKKILYIQNPTNKDTDLIAIANMSIWLLHPFLVSTTLYVIQRMAMLPLTFVLLGLLFYLKFRELSCQRKRLKIFYLLIALYICTFLAVLSKENGIILPFFIILLEKVIIKNSKVFKLNKLHISLIYFPIAFIVLAFVYKMPDFLQGFFYRDFSLIERIMTESRVIMNYLGHLFLPKFLSPGVFADGFILSTSLISPITTIFSLFAIFIILIFSYQIRNKYPIISFSLLFYFIGQIIESTFIPLEIYFEHRNYLPSIFLFLPIPYLLTKYLKVYNIHLILLTGIIVYLANTTYRKSVLWSDTTKLMLHAADNFPRSIRAIDEKVRYYIQNGNTDLAIELLKKSIEKFPDTSLRVNLINLKCYKQTVTSNDFKFLNGYIKSQPLSRHDAASIKGLLNVLINLECLNNNFELADKLINTIKENEHYNVPKINKVILSSEIYLGLKMYKMKASYYKLSGYLNIYHDFSDIMNIATTFIVMNEFYYAESTLNLLKAFILDNKYKYTDLDYLSQIEILHKIIKSKKNEYINSNSS